MTMNKRIQWTRFMGSLPETAILVTRQSKGKVYGNPYPVAKHGRDEALRLYRIYLDEEIKKGTIDLFSLIGYDLACSCKPGDACHADILLEKIEQIIKR